jgi:hypothetical protein
MPLKDQLMPALGQKQTFAAQKAMSALPPKADIVSRPLSARASWVDLWVSQNRLIDCQSGQ